MDDEAAAAGGVGGSGSGEGMGGDGMPRGSAFDRLRNALRAAKMWATVDGRSRRLAGGEAGSSVGGGGRGGAAAAAVGLDGSNASASTLPKLAELCAAEDLRPKIFSVLQAIGWDAVEEGIAGSLEEWPLASLVTWELVKRFPDLAVAAAWADVRDALRLDDAWVDEGSGVSAAAAAALAAASPWSTPASTPRTVGGTPLFRVEPTPEDARVLRAALRTSRAQVERTLSAQESAVEAVSRSLRGGEDKFLNDVRDRRIATEEGARASLVGRRLGPAILTGEERRVAKDRKKEMLARAKAPTAARPFDPDLLP